MGSLVSAFSGNLETSPRVAEFIIAPINDSGAIDESIGGARLLQYWPDSFDEQFSSNWQEKNILGSPLPIYYWTSGAARTFSFTAYFSRDMDGVIGKDVEEDKHNVDIDAALAWLRVLSLNDYRDIGDVKAVAIPPPVLWVNPTGMKIGHNTRVSGVFGHGGKDDGVYCVLLDVSVSRMNWFQSGITRLATASLNFGETMQCGKGVFPYGRSDVLGLANNYRRKPSR